MSGTESTFLTRLVALSGRDYRQQPWWILCVEGFVFTAVAIFLTRALVPQHAGVLSVACASVALAHRFNDLLEENRDNIYVHEWSSARTNRRTALRLLGIFGGVVAAYAAATVVLGEAHTQTTFEYFLRSAAVGSDSIVSRSFGSFGSIFVHNVAVLGAFVVLGLVYWGYGAVLALVWNACTWGTALTILVLRGAHATDQPASVVVLATLSVLPHLFLEALGYLLGSLAGIFLSRAVSRHTLRGPVFWSVTRASFVLLVLAVSALALAAAAESGLT